MDYLQGDYYDGFWEIRSALNSGVIQKSFKKEVEEDILELFIRNQDNNKDFNEVIGGNIDEFIRNIVDVYSDETPRKLKVLNSLSCGLIVATVIIAFDMILDGKATGANIILWNIVMPIVSIVTLTSYKIGQNTNPKNLNYIAAGVGVLLTLVSDIIYDKVTLFNPMFENEIDIKIVLFMFIAIVIIELIIIRIVNNHDLKEN